jgi:cell division protein YceG involved in septum cleavage
MSSSNNQNDLKNFFIKLIAITFAIIVVINVTYNLIFAEKFENINKLLSLSGKENIELVKNKIRLEIEKGLRKDRIMNEEDKMLFYKLYLKIKNEFQEIEK